MAHDEFQIPTNYSEPEIRAEIDAIEHANETPEYRETPIQIVKGVQARIFALRDESLSIEKRQQKGWLNGLVFKPQNSTVNSLIDRESELGGALFGKGHRFWLDVKAHATVFNDDVADWYHMQANPANPQDPKIIRFQTAQRIHKLYKGREYPMTTQEVETFVAAVQAYEPAIQPLYPKQKP